MLFKRRQFEQNNVLKFALNRITGSGRRKHLISAAAWIVGGAIASQIFRLISNVVLARMLAPEYFGILSLVMAIVTGINLLSDVGINVSIIRNRESAAAEFMNTAWTVQAIRGLIICFICLLISFPASDFYNQRELSLLLPAIGLTSLITGLHSPSLIQLTKEFRAKRLILIEVFVQLVSSCFMIALAYFRPSVWVLAAGPFCSSLLQLAISHWVHGRPFHKFQLQASAVKEITKVGFWITASTALTFLSSQADRLLIGKLISLEFLGVYNISLSLSDPPKMLIALLCGRIFLPAISAVSDTDAIILENKVKQARIPLIAIQILGLSLLIVCAQPVISVLYDRRYADAIWIVEILSLSLWPTLLATSLEPVMLALGKPKPMVLARLVAIISLILFMLAGLMTAGNRGLIIGVGMAAVPPYFVVAIALRSESIDVLSQDLKSTVLFLLTLGGAFFVRSFFI